MQWRWCEFLVQVINEICRLGGIEALVLCKDDRKKEEVEKRGWGERPQRQKNMLEDLYGPDQFADLGGFTARQRKSIPTCAIPRHSSGFQ